VPWGPEACRWQLRHPEIAAIYIAFDRHSSLRVVEGASRCTDTDAVGLTCCSCGDPVYFHRSWLCPLRSPHNSHGCWHIPPGHQHPASWPVHPAHRYTPAREAFSALAKVVAAAAETALSLNAYRDDR
jgi:hypothetical protein